MLAGIALFAAAAAGAAWFLPDSNRDSAEPTRIELPLTPRLEAPAPSTPEPDRLLIDLPLPQKHPATTRSDHRQPVEPQAVEEPGWQTIVVRRGDTLSGLFKQAGLSQRQLHAVLESESAAQALKRIYPGQPLKMRIAQDQLLELALEIDYATTLHTKWQGEKFETRRQSRQIDAEPAVASGTITDSLFLSAQKVALSDKIIMQLVEIFGWDIDFALDIRRGDSFAVIYENLYHNGEKVSEGRILGAEFTSRGKTYQAVWFEDKAGHGDYYDESGRSMRKAFLRTPVKFTRISSRFSLGRKHPILNKIRAHKGVDYAAPYGTPIKATGDGRVVSRGRNGGYGKVIEIHHGGKYSSIYAHMKSYARGTGKGSRVKQGQIIGYVGSTGLATGPHLHYEFRVNGVHRNPLTVKLPKAKPIAKKILADFKRSTSAMLRQLAAISPVVVTAKSGVAGIRHGS